MTGCRISQGFLGPGRHALPVLSQDSFRLQCGKSEKHGDGIHACMHEGEYGHAMTVEHLELGGLVWQQPDFALLHEGS